MRTTISLEDHLGAAARRRAREAGLSLSAFIAGVLTEALARDERPVKAPPFRLITVKGDGPRPGIDLDRTSELLVREDEDAFGSRKG